MCPAYLPPREESDCVRRYWIKTNIHFLSIAVSSLPEKPPYCSLWLSPPASLSRYQTLKSCRNAVVKGLPTMRWNFSCQLGGSRCLVPCRFDSFYWPPPAEQIQLKTKIKVFIFCSKQSSDTITTTLSQLDLFFTAQTMDIQRMCRSPNLISPCFSVVSCPCWYLSLYIVPFSL